LSRQIKKAEEILRSARILDEVKIKESLLIAIARGVIKTGTMDPDTIIYRLAMMIYHSKPLAGAPVIDAVEDPGYIYLNLMEDTEIATLFEKKFEKARFVTPGDFTKTFISFVIAAYIYYKAIEERKP
jgi:hypothetical protein